MGWQGARAVAGSHRGVNRDRIFVLPLFIPVKSIDPISRISLPNAKKGLGI